VAVNVKNEISNVNNSSQNPDIMNSSKQQFTDTALKTAQKDITIKALKEPEK